MLPLKQALPEHIQIETQKKVKYEHADRLAKKKKKNRSRKKKPNSCVLLCNACTHFNILKFIFVYTLLIDCLID